MTDLWYAAAVYTPAIVLCFGAVIFVLTALSDRHDLERIRRARRSANPAE